MTNKNPFSKKEIAMFKEDIKKKSVVDEEGDLALKGVKDTIKITNVKKTTERLISEKEKKQLRLSLGENYEKLIEIMKEYVDIREEYYPIIATWIIGTYLHDSFNTFPYLFINAMRGSGKTRLLKLVAALSNNGELIGSLTEAVMFRMPKGQTVCIDEFEGLMRKGNEPIRELLNACYKKGMKIRRMKKQKTMEGTEQVIEEFEPYKPICLANIWGMEEVLGDRCITIILEKSNRKDVMRLIEDFDEKTDIKLTKQALNTILVQLCSYFGVEGYIEKWNKYIKNKYSTLHTYTTLTTQTTDTTLEKHLDFFNKIDGTGINGRNLELFFPLILISRVISEDAFESVLSVAKTITSDRKREEMVESKDVSLIDFVSKLPTGGSYIPIKLITDNFRSFIGNVEENEDRWINERWVGRALKRLNLIIDKRRVSSGTEVTLNIPKAQEKLNIFK